MPIHEAAYFKLHLQTVEKKPGIEDRPSTRLGGKFQLTTRMEEVGAFNKMKNIASQQVGEMERRVEEKKHRGQHREVEEHQTQYDVLGTHYM